jgi:thiol:disulfide interchange protein DsbC
MKFCALRSIVAILLAVSWSSVRAGDEVDPAVVEALTGKLSMPAMGLRVESVSASDLPGLYEVQYADGGPVVYATGNGDFFLLGDLYTVTPDGFVNLAEQRRDGQRREKMAAVKREDMIVFSPEGEPRAHINVFTDVTCFYCQKLHREVPELNRRGVEVRYLAYPRAGTDSDGYRKLVSAWCADDPRDALTRLKQKESVKENLCTPNPIAQQYRLGQEMGVRGTPAIVTEDGQMIPGYQSADELMVTLGLN